MYFILTSCPVKCSNFNPIIFFGYNIGDENIKSILKTIFTYIESNSEQAKRIRENFLLVEYESGSMSEEILEHDIDMAGFNTIRINKIKTDNFAAIYNAISNLQLPISALDIRKVETVVREIHSGGNIAVKITEDLDDLKNSEKILAIGTDKTIQYTYLTSTETIANYFKIMDESNFQILSLIDKYKIQSNQYFPIFGFSTINQHLASTSELKKQQQKKLKDFLSKNVSPTCKTKHATILGIQSDTRISSTNKEIAIFWSIMNDKLNLDDIEVYLREHLQKRTSDYNRLLCAYDFKKYSGR